MSADREFTADPVLFLSRNVVRIGYNNAAGGVRTFTLVPDEGYEAESFHGAKLGFYYLREATGGEPDAFAAYWCGYEETQFKFAVVWKDADFLFTATMSGCTFAVGSDTASGARLVGHVNSAQVGGGAPAQAADQNRRARRVVGPSGTLFEPKDYREKPNEVDVFESTTLGVRDRTTGKWSFYAQVYLLGMGTVTLRSIKKIA
jgi:hypothetical protein